MNDTTEVSERMRGLVAASHDAIDEYWGAYATGVPLGDRLATVKAVQPAEDALLTAIAALEAENAALRKAAQEAFADELFDNVLSTESEP